jgi:site-specific recombinase XerD
MGKNPSRVAIQGTLAAYKDGLVEDLRRQGYTPQTSVRIVSMMAHIGLWLTDNDLGPDQFTTHQIERFLRQRRLSGYRQFVTPRGLQPVVSFLRQEGAIPAEEVKAPPRTRAGKLLERYAAYLIRERQLCPRVVTQYQRRARHFMSATFDAEAQNFGALTAPEVAAYVLAETRASSVGYSKLKVVALRAFLRYLHSCGEVPKDLSGVLPAAAGWRLAGLPKFLTTPESKKLMAAPDRRTHVGCRDYAVLLTMLRLGLRAGEVASLALDDMDWSRGELVVRGKGGRQDTLPLPPDVGKAIVSYLRRGRPHSSSRKLFLCSRAPHRDLTSGAVTMISLDTGKRCGIPRMGAHRLRHTAATQLLWNGASLPEIGQVLRHRHVDTTAIYAKVDRSSLRTICCPWPGAIS